MMIFDMNNQRALSLDDTKSNHTHIFVYRLHPEYQRIDGRNHETALFKDGIHSVLHETLSKRSRDVFKIYPGKTYLDLDCVPCLAALETRMTRARYLCNCSVFVPELAAIDEAHDRESEDAGRLKAVLPILRDESEGRTSLSSACGSLSRKPSVRSCVRASELIQAGGVRRDRETILEYLLGVSVQEAVAMLLPAGRRAEVGLGEETRRGKGSKGVAGMYVDSAGDVERSAREAGELIADCLVRVVKEHIDRKLWEFSKHNPRGIEVLQVLQETGMYEKFNEYFALRGIETLDKLPLFTRALSQAQSCIPIVESCLDITAYNASDESSIRTLEKLVEDYKKDERFLPLNDRLRQYRDADVNGVLALRTTNSLETALVKLPARSCIVFLSLVYLVFGIKQLGPIMSDQVWLPDKSSGTPVEPKTVRISVMADPIISFAWSLLFLSGVLLGLLSTPLRAKWLLLSTGHLVLTANVACMVADLVQCSTQGTGIGAECNGFSGIITVSFLAIMMYLAHFVQQYFWMAAFLAQGAYCFYSALAVQNHFRYVMLCLGVGCWLVELAIAVEYHRAYARTFRELKAAMRGFEDTWTSVVEESSHVVQEISARVRAIAQELEEVIGDDTRTWRRYLWVTLGLRGRRYSRRNGKIRQASRDFEQLFLQAQEVSAAFQLWVSGWNRVGRVEHGNVKSCARAMQKTVRSYRRDPSCLTDLVRCTIVVSSIDDVLSWLSFLRGQSVVGHGVSAWDKPGGGRVMSEDVEVRRAERTETARRRK